MTQQSPTPTKTASPTETVLITGATGGIGRATAHALAPSYHLILHGRNLAALQGLKSELQNANNANNVQISLLQLDLSAPATFAQNETLQTIAPTHIIHNAGTAKLDPIAQAKAHDWQQTLTVNVIAPAELTRLLLPSVRRGRGSVIFINSGAGLRANAGWGTYAASKHALKALADALRQEEAPRGVRVSSLYPGRTATEMQRGIRQQEGQPYHAAEFIQPQTVADVVRYVLSAPRGVSLDDVAVRPAPKLNSN